MKLKIGDYIYKSYTDGGILVGKVLKESYDSYANDIRIDVDVYYNESNRDTGVRTYKRNKKTCSSYIYKNWKTKELKTITEEEAWVWLI